MKLVIRYIRRHLGIFLLSLLFLTMEAVADLMQPASIITRITNDVTQVQDFVNGIYFPRKGMLYYRQNIMQLRHTKYGDILPIVI